MVAAAALARVVAPVASHSANPNAASGAPGSISRPTGTGQVALRSVHSMYSATPQLAAAVRAAAGLGVGLPRFPRPGVQCQAGSVDVSNEEKDEPSPSPETDGEPIELDSRRGLEERFAVLYSGVHECSSCGYQYDQTVGDKSYPIPPGMEFRSLPDDWLCPTCGAAKSYFKSKSVEVAGFAQNQNYGLGGNSLTSGQKSLLIYGSLIFFFALFLSGYFLQ